MECAICHEAMTIDLVTHENPVGEVIAHDPFHRECINRWYQEGHNTCPLCQQVVEHVDDWITAQMAQ